MGKVTVKIDAEVRGKRFDLQFDWFGGGAEIASAIKDVGEAARRAGMTPKALTHGVLQYLFAVPGLLKDPGQREFQLMPSLG